MNFAGIDRHVVICEFKGQKVTREGDYGEIKKVHLSEARSKEESGEQGSRYRKITTSFYGPLIPELDYRYFLIK